MIARQMSLSARWRPCLSVHESLHTAGDVWGVRASLKADGVLWPTHAPGVNDSETARWHPCLSVHESLHTAGDVWGVRASLKADGVLWPTHAPGVNDSETNAVHELFCTRLATCGASGPA